MSGPSDPITLPTKLRGSLGIPCYPPVGCERDWWRAYDRFCQQLPTLEEAEFGGRLDQALFTMTFLAVRIVYRRLPTCHRRPVCDGKQDTIGPN